MVRLLDPPAPTDTHMAGKKKTKPTRSGTPLHVWLDEPLREAIEAARKKNRRSLRDEVSIALEKYLTEQGLWPPEGQ